MKKALLFALSVGGLLAAQPARAADILVDSTPADIGDFITSLSTTSTGFNYLASFTLGTTVDITGFEIAYLTTRPNVGDDIVIRYLDGGGLHSFTDQIDAIESYEDFGAPYWATSNFSPITLGPGTYLMGMSGAPGVALDWLGYDSGGPPGLTFPLIGENFLDFDGDGFGDALALDMTFRVLGTPGTGAVPEPASWALMITGFGLAGAALRRRAERLRLA